MKLNRPDMQIPCIFVNYIIIELDRDAIKQVQ